MKEIWKDIPGCNGLYRASTLGRIKSLPHTKTVRLKGGLLRLSNTPSNRLYCGITINGEHKTIAVHILIAMTFLSYKPNKCVIVVDHIDFNTLNNRLDNLQIITHRENLSKDKFRKNPTSEYTGVCWYKRTSKWISNITINNKLIHLGYFINEIDASNAYQKALKAI